MRIKALVMACLLASTGNAQDGVDNVAPPEWLSETLLSPHSNIATSALPGEITSMPIGAIRLDAVGLLSPVQTGLPADLWAGTDAATLANLFRAQPSEGLPAILSFTTMLALSELNPPPDATADSELFLARLDMLLARGAIDAARALMERAGPTSPQVFRRWFDVSILTGQTDRACTAMRANPDIAPSFPARIFCLARSGDWPAAALTLGTGEALGYVTETEGDLIARFLDPELFEGEPPLPPDPSPTPLFYEMRVAIGERQGAATLPLAFAYSDLSNVAGWRAQLDAAERLARSGAITGDQWQLIYTSRVPSATGGVWDRVDAVQEFDVSMLSQDVEDIEENLTPAWLAVQEAGLEVAFADVYADRLLRMPLTGEAAVLARRIGLLSAGYEQVPQRAVAQSNAERFLFAIARGQSAPPAPAGAMPRMIAGAFSQPGIPDRYARFIRDDQLGEALLRASLILADGAGDLDDMQDALRLFRALGLETVARRAALQIMILDRRG